MAASASSGVLTFLFTDIEGSTRRWEDDADGMRASLATHDRVLRDAISASGGTLFKHTGDGVCAVFTSPTAAVDAAVAAQRTLELPVRMGIATGEAEHRDGDYFGPALNRSARIMAAGHGGQILIDGAIAGQVGSIALVDLGSKRLRDIARPVNVLQVRASGLREDFPPLRVKDANPGNLRPLLTSFVGRAAESADVAKALGEHRAVTLIGVGGVGKTRLAIEVASRTRERYLDGVFVVELAAVTDPDAVPAAVAAAVGVTQQPGQRLIDSVAATMEGLKRLLIFDNCEHVLDAAAAVVEAILAASSTVTILATSREGLGVGDERLWPVPSLTIGSEPDSDAAALFIERASGVAADASLLDEDSGRAVVDICRRLDGIALAIELAASRLQSMTVTEVRDRLDDRFRLLVGSRRGLERHQTLHHAVQWSYDLLDDAQRELLQRCSVFAGGFDLIAAAAVSEQADDFTTLDVLDALVRKSLLIADRSGTHTRFSMLETIRQFAEEQLVGGGRADHARSAHAAHFARRAGDLAERWDGPRQRETYEWVDTELANLRAGFRWASDHAELDTAAAIVVHSGFLRIWSREQYEAVGWAEELLEPAEAVQHHQLARLYSFAAQCYSSGRTSDAIRYADRCRELIDGGRFRPLPFDAEVWQGGGYVSAGQPERWVEVCRRVIERDADPHLIARSVLVFALNAAGAHDDVPAAAASLNAEAEHIDNPNMASFALLAYGIATRPRDPDAAYEVLTRGLHLAHTSGNRFAESQTAAALARLSAAHRDPLEAFEYLELVIRHYRDSGSFVLMHSPMVTLADLFDRLGHREPAARLCGFARNPWTLRANPELLLTVSRLDEALGTRNYEALAAAGHATSGAAMAAYALEQIDLARAELG